MSRRAHLSAISSVLASMTLPLLTYLTSASQPVTVCALGVTAIVIFRHRENVARLHAGTERQIGQRI